MPSPAISFFKWKLRESDGAFGDLPELFVQILSYPNSVLWVWIGDHQGNMNNLSLALKSHNVEKPKLKDIHSTTVINPNESNETNVKSKSLAKRLSLALNGRPVYLSYSFNQHSEAMEELLQLSEMETKLFQLIKSQPRFE